jgi:hypothetical protein
MALIGVRGFAVQLIITTSLTAMTALLPLVILIMDHPFGESVRVEPEPFVRLLQRVDHMVLQAPRGAFEPSGGRCQLHGYCPRWSVSAFSRSAEGS